MFAQMEKVLQGFGVDYLLPRENCPIIMDQKHRIIYAQDMAEAELHVTRSHFRPVKITGIYPL